MSDFQNALISEKPNKELQEKLNPLVQIKSLKEVSNKKKTA